MGNKPCGGCERLPLDPGKFTDEFGRHTVFTTQTTEDTYQKIFKLIDAIPAVVWSSPTGFMHVMQFLNSPGVQDAKHGHRERAV